MGNAVLHHMNVDLETYSDVDLGKAGLYQYAQSPAFAILLFAYSMDHGPVHVVDLTQPGAHLPPEVLRWLFDPQCIKHAYNAAFEWYCLSRWFHLEEHQSYPPERWLPQWRCTMLHGMYLGYPGGLDACGQALELPQDMQKMATGKALIRYFCVPCNPTKNNGWRTRNLPHHDPGKWQTFQEYNRQDVVTEMEIERRLSAFPVPDDVQRQWETDLSINLRGVGVDMDLVNAARQMDVQTREELIQEASALSGLENPNSVAQLIQWLQQETGLVIPDLKQATVTGLLGETLPNQKTKRMLEIRQELGKTSNKKYDALEVATCTDHRVRGLLQFYGANRTGRWAGRIVQPQNLPRTYIAGELLPLARDLVKTGQRQALGWMFGSVSDTLSQLIRTAFVASPGQTLLDADFSAIEARVIAWLAGEEWVLDVFRTHGKIYEATASQMFHIPLDRIRKGNPEYSYRQKGKVATLALGYQGSVGAMRAMDTGHELDSLEDEEVLELVELWRQANPSIVQLWRTVEAAALEAVHTGRSSVLQGGRLTIRRECDVENALDFLTIQLPSSRKLYYPNPHIAPNRFGRPSLCYWGMDQQSHRWVVLETYGGKLVENITQAIARDCLAEAVERLEQAGFPVVFHIHDEVVVEAPLLQQGLDTMETLMVCVPLWAEGLPLNADGWVNPFFKKG